MLLLLLLLLLLLSILSGHRGLNCQKGVGVYCNRSLHQYDPELRMQLRDRNFIVICNRETWMGNE